MTNENSQENSAIFVGQILKASRIEQELTLEAIAKKLRISKRQLVNLEEDHENLVCDVYTLGFLRSYARCLGLDENDICQKFKDQSNHPKPLPHNFPAPLPGKGRPSFRILGLCLVGLLTVIMGWRWFGSSPLTPASQEGTNLAEFIQKQNVEPLPSEPSSPIQQVSSPPEQAIEVPHSPTVFIKTTEEAWIEVKDKDGKIIVSKLFAPNESFEVKDPQNLFLKTGNAKGTQLIFGNKTHALSDKQGEVKSNVSLNPEKWVEESPKTD